MDSTGPKCVGACTGGCAIEMAVTQPVCTGESLPAALVQRLDTAQQLLSQAARAGDMVARTGGEEFSILLPDTGSQGALNLAERLCDRIRKQAFIANGKEVSITASIGIVSARPGRGESDANLKLRADEALYAAKHAGRNCVRVWESHVVEVARPVVRA